MSPQRIRIAAVPSWARRRSPRRRRCRRPPNPQMDALLWALDYRHRPNHFGWIRPFQSIFRPAASSATL